MVDEDEYGEAARRWTEAGFAPVTTHEDGTKRPASTWQRFQNVAPEWCDIQAMLGARQFGGLGVVTGQASENIEMLEIEGPLAECDRRLNAVRELAHELGHSALLERALSGCCERSAGGGLHIFLRIDGECRGNTKLALEGQGDQRKVAAETRGQGGFVVTWPTTARRGHPEGSRYELVDGTDPSTVTCVTERERDLLYNIVIAALDEPDERAQHSPPRRMSSSSSTSFGALTPWDDFAAQVTWRELLEPQGWTHVRKDPAGRDHWTRPGKDLSEGTSATSIENGPLYAFSTSTSLPAGVGMSKSYVHAHYEHSGDMSAAASDLRTQGYGDPFVASIGAFELQASNDTFLDHDGFETAVARRLQGLRVAEEAARRIAIERTANAPELAGVRLGDLLAQPDTPTPYRINGLWPAQGRVLLAAAAKSGKTTMVVANLLPALVDGEEFLGRYEAQRVAGTVVYLNLEVGDSIIRSWLRDADIIGVDKVLVANLRGRAAALTLASDAGRQRLADWLRGNNAEIVILDPLAPLLASLGIDENSNADVARFFTWWTEVLTLAGVQDDLIVHHTGHGGQRSRGASRLLDEPDAIWTLAKEREETHDADGFAPLAVSRQFTAYGRDVDVPSTTLGFEPENRRLIATGTSPAAARKASTTNSQRLRILDFLRSRPLANTRAISAHAGVQKGAVPNLLRVLVDDGLIVVTRNGQEHLYSLTTPSPVPHDWGGGTGDGETCVTSPFENAAQNAQIR